ncbi:MAG: serine protein kinase RIO, partial [Candidatus Aenigmarchaeota archaeon]|nr:serine protein kinase RIO [Candidatus Aenigmarchaeota archaeon]
MSEELEVLEEVFDRSTLMILYKMLNNNVISKVFGVVKSGKESRIYKGEDSEGKELALKIYLVVSSEFRKGILP